MTHQELTRTTPWVNPGKGKQPGRLAGGLAVAVAGTAIAATLELRHLGVDPGGDPGGVRQQTLRSISWPYQATPRSRTTPWAADLGFL
jgi:hypothetical protein